MKLNQKYAQKLESLQNLEVKESIEKALQKDYYVQLTLLEGCNMCNYLAEQPFTLINLLKMFEV